MRDVDPDETEGRALYRAQADALARAQMSMARRRVTLKRKSPSPAEAREGRGLTTAGRASGPRRDYAAPMKEA